MSGDSVGGWTPPDEREIAEANAALRDAPMAEVLRWATERFRGGQLALVSAFGPGSAVLLDQLVEIGEELPVVFVDTLHHFGETLEHVERVRERYGLDVRVYRAAPTRAEFEAEHGERLWERDLGHYQQLTKVEPFARATEPLDGWITGRRRDQARSREGMEVVEGGDKVRVNPLAGWTRREVWQYIYQRDLPYNPLHDRGYASIGDEPLTTPVAAGEDERAGRWRGVERLECGIHLVHNQ